MPAATPGRATPSPRRRPGARSIARARRVRPRADRRWRSCRIRIPTTTSASRRSRRRSTSCGPPTGESMTARGARPRARAARVRRGRRGLAARGTRLVHPALGVARREAGVELDRVGSALPAHRRRAGALRRRSGAHGQRQLAGRRAALPRPHARCSPATSRPRARPRSSPPGSAADGRRRQGRRTTAARPRRPRASSRRPTRRSR